MIRTFTIATGQLDSQGDVIKMDGIKMPEPIQLTENVAEILDHYQRAPSASMAMLNTSFFEPIVQYIRHIDFSKNYLEIELPVGLIVDNNELLKHYKDDVVIVYQVDIRPVIKGTLQDATLFNYLIGKYYEIGAAFNK